MTRLHDPLALLLIIPMFAAVLWSVIRERRSAVLYSSAQLIKSLPVTLAARVKRLLPWVRFTGLALIVIAIARPQSGLEEFRVRTEGIAIQMCIDRSLSMRSLDFELHGERANRLETVKKVFKDFVVGDDGLDGRADDLIGLITFGGFAEAKSPLTLDHGALVHVLETVDFPQPIENSQGRVINAHLLQEEYATAIGDAVTLAVDRLKDAKAKSKVIILLSDGENTAGSVEPKQAAEAAKAFGIKIYAIGVGSTGAVPFPQLDDYGRERDPPRLVQATFHIDEQTLKMMADTTDGEYFNAKNTAALVNVYEEIDQLEKTVTESLPYVRYKELYLWFIVPGIVLLMLEVVLSSTRFRSLP